MAVPFASPSFSLLRNEKLPLWEHVKIEEKWIEACEVKTSNLCIYIDLWWQSHLDSYIDPPEGRSPELAHKCGKVSV